MDTQTRTRQVNVSIGQKVVDVFWNLGLQDILLEQLDGQDHYGIDVSWDISLLISHRHWVRDSIVFCQSSPNTPDLGDNYLDSLNYDDDLSGNLFLDILLKHIDCQKNIVERHAFLKRMLLCEGALKSHLETLEAIETRIEVQGNQSSCEKRLRYHVTNDFHNAIEYAMSDVPESSSHYQRLKSAADLVIPDVDAETAKAICHSMVIGGDVELSSHYAWSILLEAACSYAEILYARVDSLERLNSDIALINQKQQKAVYDERMSAHIKEMDSINANADSLLKLLRRYSGKQLLGITGLPECLNAWIPVAKAKEKAESLKAAASEADSYVVRAVYEAVKAEETDKLTKQMGLDADDPRIKYRVAMKMRR